MVDASIVLAAVLPDEQDAFCVDTLRRTGTEGAPVPPHWSLELANGLLMAFRRGRLDRGDLDAALGAVGRLPVTIDPAAASTLDATLRLAERLGLTVCDAAYVELAMRSGLDLATRDADLRRAASAAGAGVLP